MVRVPDEDGSVILSRTDFGTVTVQVAVLSDFESETVIFAVPTFTAVTSPLLVTVATEGFWLFQLSYPPEVVFAVRVEVLPTERLRFFAEIVT